MSDRDNWVYLRDAQITRTHTAKSRQIVVLDERLLQRPYWVPKDAVQPGLAGRAVAVKKWWADENGLKYDIN